MAQCRTVRVAQYSIVYFMRCTVSYPGFSIIRTILKDHAKVLVIKHIKYYDF